jgi:hypothetical protein
MSFVALSTFLVVFPRREKLQVIIENRVFVKVSLGQVELHEYVVPRFSSKNSFIPSYSVLNQSISSDGIGRLMD